MTHKDDCGCMWCERRPLVPPYLPDMTPEVKPPLRGPYYAEGKSTNEDDILELE